MRLVTIVSTLILSLILLSAHFSSHENARPEFVFLGEGSPQLPEIPYAYANSDFPEYFTDGSSFHYKSVNADNLSQIDNNVATLGRVLFYDEILSANENISCATCHQQEFSFADDVKFSIGTETRSEVNTPHLNDLGWSNDKVFGWDMRFKTIEDVIKIPLTHPNELAVTDLEAMMAKMKEQSYYPDLFTKAFGQEEITEARIVTSLAQFIQSMTTLNTRWDNIIQGETQKTTNENTGEKLFVEHCVSCHVSGSPSVVDNLAGNTTALLQARPELFTNLVSLGEEDLGAGSWQEEFTGLFKTLSLRNIGQTAPYMHDGRFGSLAAVVEHYSTGLPGTNSSNHWHGGGTTGGGTGTEPVNDLLPNFGFSFTEYQKQCLVAFLETLTDEAFLTDVKFSDPFAKEEAPLDHESYVGKTKVFPNPTTGPLHFSFENLIQQKIEVHLLDIQGRLVRQLSSHKNGLSTDISELPAGTYFAKVIHSLYYQEDFKIIKID